MIRTIILDDEVDAAASLEILLKQYCPQIEVIAVFNKSKEGITGIRKFNPDLLFLDIEMPNKNGFEVLEEIKEIPLAVIFTTAFHQYAIKAIRYSALDYLLKPVDPAELILAVDRFAEKKSNPNSDQFQFLLDVIAKKENTFRKIAIPNLEGFKLINSEDILFCQAEGNYTHIHLKSGEKILASRSLKEIQFSLEEYKSFVRVHHSTIVNINEVSQYIKSDGGYLILSDGQHINVSRNKKDGLMKYFT